MGSRIDPVIFSTQMPKQWADMIRNAPMDQVRPLGVQQSNSFRSQANSFSSRPNLVSNPAQHLAEVDSQLEMLRRGSMRSE